MSDSVTKYFENATSTVSNEISYNKERNVAKNGKVLEKQDEIVEDVLAKYRERSLKGIETYGTTLQDSSEDMKAFLIHLQEELMDSTLYLQKLIKQIDDATKDAT